MVLKFFCKIGENTAFFAIFFRNFLQIFENSPASGGLRTRTPTRPDPLPWTPPKFFPVYATDDNWYWGREGLKGFRYFKWDSSYEILNRNWRTALSYHGGKANYLQVFKLLCADSFNSLIEIFVFLLFQHEFSKTLKFWAS